MNHIGTSLVNRMRLRLNRWLGVGSGNCQLTMANCQLAVDRTKGQIRGSRREFVLGTLTLALCVCMLATGCAVHYFDKQTGTEHLWGFGHLKMKAAPRAEDGAVATNAAVAFVTGVRTLGLNLGAGEEYAGVTAGWDSRFRVIIKQEDSSFCLLWPTNSIWLPQDLKDIFTIRVGTNCPGVPLKHEPTATPTSSHP